MPSTSYSLASTEEIIADMRAGKMVVLVDEEDRENEGDLVLAADHVTPETWSRLDLLDPDSRTMRATQFAFDGA
ncbi:MAG: hypothetical protein RIR50_1396 [Pseudomonadota bacterium]